MRHLRPFLPLGFWLLSIACLSGTHATAYATSPSQPNHASPVDVEFSIRSVADHRELQQSPDYQALEGPLNPLEQQLFADAADGRWDDHDLLSAALVASGVDATARLERYAATLASLAEELRRNLHATGTPHQQAQDILEFLHHRILRGGYHLDSSDLALALDQGRFNCVSASVLFNCLAQRVGLTAVGLEIPGHAMSRLVFASGSLDVETTCPEWFRLMDQPEKQAALVEKTIGLRSTQTLLPAQRREVTPVELVATIYYNRGVDLLSQKRFAEAVAANAKALRLDPANSTARGNLLATLNNWAIDLGTRGSFVDAVATLERGIALDPTYATFKTNYVHLHHQWIESLGRLGQFQEAARALENAQWKKLDAGYFRRAQLDLYRQWARACLQADRIDEAFDVFASARRQLGLTPEWLLQEVAELNRQAATLLEEQRHAEAVILLDRAVAWCPDVPVLDENRRTAVMRWAQPAFQQGDFAEAIRRTTHGGTPGHLDELLVNNVRYGYYQWILQLLAKGQKLEARQIAQEALADPFLAGHTDGIIPALSSP